MKRGGQRCFPGERYSDGLRHSARSQPRFENRDDAERIQAVRGKMEWLLTDKEKARAASIRMNAEGEAEENRAAERQMSRQRRAIIYGLSVLIFSIRYLL